MRNKGVFMDLLEQISKLNRDLSQSIKLLRQNGEEYAKKERDYKITLRQEALKLRQEKGMAVTLIDLIIYGVPEVAQKRFERDVAQAMYEANKEHINTVKLQLRLLESQLNREWGNG